MGCCYSNADERATREPLLDGPKNVLAKGEKSADFFKAMEINLKSKINDGPMPAAT